MLILALNIYFIIIFTILLVGGFYRKFNSAIIFYFIVLFLNIYFALINIKILF